MVEEKDRREKQSHTRVNDILLGPLERPALAWLVKKMPPWVTPDILTFTGLFASFIVMFAYILCGFNKGFLFLASFGFILNWLGDSLDGNLARYRKIERPSYGFFIDHSVDTISIVAIFIGLGLSPFVTFQISLLALIGYLCMEIMVLSATYANGVFQISYSKLGPTEVRAIAILVNTVLFFMSEPKMQTPLGSYGLYDVVLVLITCLLFFFFISGVLHTARELAVKEKR